MFMTSLRKTERAAGRRARAGFTLIELLVVVAIIAVLMAILLPSLNTARQQARGVACMSNLRQIGIAIRMYADENNGTIPLGKKSWDPAAGTVNWQENPWNVRLYPYLNIVAPSLYDGNGNVRTMYTGPFRCPGKMDYNPSSSASDLYHISYALNTYNPYEAAGQTKYQKFNNLDMYTLLVTDDHSTGSPGIASSKYLYNQTYRAYGWYHENGHNMLFPGGDVQKVRDMGVDWFLKLTR